MTKGLAFAQLCEIIVPLWLRTNFEVGLLAMSVPSKVLQIFVCFFLIYANFSYEKNRSISRSEIPQRWANWRALVIAARTSAIIFSAWVAPSI